MHTDIVNKECVLTGAGDSSDPRCTAPAVASAAADVLNLKSTRQKET